MTDAAKNENIDDPNVDDLKIDHPELKDDPQDEPEDLPQFSEAEALALKGGWKPREEWEDDPDDWTSAKRFNQTRDLIESNKSLRAQTDRMEHNFENRITNLQKLHDQSLTTQIQGLKTKRDSAAAEADMDVYNDTNKQIDELEKTETQPQPVNEQDYVSNVVNHPKTQAFITDNPWIKDNSSAKGIYGQRVFTDWLQANRSNPNAILEEGLSLVKESVNKEFPQKNLNRDTQTSMGDRGAGSRKSTPRNRLTMNDLSREEQNIWESMGNSWKNQEEFLQAVADDRKGE